MRADHAGTGPDLAVLEGAVRADHRVLGDHGGAEQLGARQERHVLGRARRPRRSRCRGVHHRDPVAHPAGDDAAVQLAAQLAASWTRSLAPSVWRTSSIAKAPTVRPSSRAMPHGVGEVVLALRVVVGQPRQGPDQELGVEGEDAGVDLRGSRAAGRWRPSPRRSPRRRPRRCGRSGRSRTGRPRSPLRMLTACCGRPWSAAKRRSDVALQQRRVPGRDQHGAAGRPARPRAPPGRRGRCRRCSSCTASTASGTSSCDVRADLLALVADDGHDPVAAPTARTAIRTWPIMLRPPTGAGPSWSWTSSGCRRRRPGRRRSARQLSSSCSPGRSRTYVASPDSKSGGPCRQTNRGLSAKDRPAIPDNLSRRVPDARSL